MVQALFGFQFNSIPGVIPGFAETADQFVAPFFIPPQFDEFGYSGFLKKASRSAICWCVICWVKTGMAEVFITDAEWEE